MTLRTGIPTGSATSSATDGFENMNKPHYLEHGKNKNQKSLPVALPILPITLPMIGERELCDVPKNKR